MAYAEKIFKTRNGKKTKQYTWRCRYLKPDGTWGSEPGFPTEALAKKWGRKQESDIEAGIWCDPELMRSPFGEFARKYMKAKTKRGRTMSRRWDYLDDYVLPKWEYVPLNGINWFDVDAWQQTLSCDDVTAGHVVTFMSSVMTGAVDARYLPVNPLFGRRRTKRFDDVERAQARKADEEKWAPPEVVLELARRLGPANGLHVLTTAFLGPRWGEAIGTRTDSALYTRRQINDGDWFECPVLRLSQEVAEYEARDADGKKLGTLMAIEPLKNDGSMRDVDVPPFLHELLTAHVESWPHEFLFCTPRGKRWRRSNFGRLLRPAADGREAVAARRGTGGREAWPPIMTGLTMRDLRHTADTYQAQIGVKPVLAHESMGHKLSGIKRVYQHPTPEMRQRRLDGLQEIYERAMKNLGWDQIWE